MEWLSDYLNLNEIDANDLADRLSKTGIEVESVNNYGKNLNNLVVGQVKELVPHPDSDHLSLTQVEIAPGKTQQIVCGAPNVALNQKVIVALEGAILPGGLEIKPTQLRGQESNGMICSLQELGFSDSVVAKEYAKGIFVLPEDAPVGADIVDYLHLDDNIIELDITPNRADALSIHGAAHEVGAILSQKPNFKTLALDSLVNGDSAQGITIEVEDPSISPHYQLRLIQNVSIKESPLWVQLRLMKAGIRPINNVVDVTNYFLLLYGQPMHSFDYDLLPSKNIRVAYAEEGQVFTTLDNVDRKLSTTDVLIKAGDTPVALAGVMGGLDTEVTDKTTNVLLETAVFDSQNVRTTSKKFGLRSESSARFEKGINIATINEAGELAAEFMAQLAGGEVADKVVEYKDIDLSNTKVDVNNNALEEKIGIQLSNEEIETIIDRLGFTVEFHEDHYTVEIPPRRWDIEIEADVLEEIARIYGYDNIPLTLPTSPSRSGRLTNKQSLVRQLRSISEGMGLNQVISYVLTSDDHANLLKSDEADFVKLDLPMSEERTVLRQSMFPALLEIAQFNNARQNKDLAFYEAGRVFFSQGAHKQPIEAERFAILLSGTDRESTWYGNKAKYDFYSIKGMVESIMEALRLSDSLSFEVNADIKVMHPARTANVLLDGQNIGFLGQIHPNVADEFDLDHATFFAELDFDAIVAYDRPSLIQTAIPKFPSTSQDIALLVDIKQSHQDLVDIIKENGPEYLISVQLFDQYKGENIAADKQSLAYHLVFQHPDQTLTDNEVKVYMDKINAALKEIDGLEIR